MCNKGVGVRALNPTQLATSKDPKPEEQQYWTPRLCETSPVNAPNLVPQTQILHSKPNIETPNPKPTRNAAIISGSPMMVWYEAQGLGVRVTMYIVRVAQGS